MNRYTKEELDKAYNDMSYRLCCAPYDEGREAVVGICPDCGAAINKEGKAVYGCSYSPSICDTCGYSPCDRSC